VFSLKEVADEQFVYRCHECGWESEIMTKQQAIGYTRSHKCMPSADSKSVTPPVTKPPKD